MGDLGLRKIEEVEPLPDEIEALNEEHEYLSLEEVKKIISKPSPYGR